MEVYVLVERKKPILIKILAILLMTVGSALALLSMFAIAFLPIAVITFGLGIFLHTRNYEFECSYFNGELRFAKIINKSSRKKLPEYTMDEVVTIAPTGDRSIYHYENGEKIKTRDYSSGGSKENVYIIIVKTKTGLEMIKFEPNEKYLDAVCARYSQKVVR